MSSKIELETLVAFADGELSAAEHAELEAQLAADPEAEGILAELNAGARLLRAAYSDPAIQEVPEELRAEIEGLLGAAAKAPARGLRQRMRGWASWLRPPNYAVPALLVFLAVAAGYGLAEWRLDERFAAFEAARQQDRELLEAAIDQALEKHLSGQVVAWRNPESGSHGEVVPVRTFKTEDGHWCREYRKIVVSESGKEEIHYGIACRDAGGGWRTRVQTTDDS